MPKILEYNGDGKLVKVWYENTRIIEEDDTVLKFLNTVDDNRLELGICYAVAERLFDCMDEMNILMERMRLSSEEDKP